MQIVFELVLVLSSPCYVDALFDALIKDIQPKILICGITRCGISIHQNVLELLQLLLVNTFKHILKTILYSERGNIYFVQRRFVCSGISSCSSSVSFSSSCRSCMDRWSSISL